jgi:hypothetical protein
MNIDSIRRAAAIARYHDKRVRDCKVEIRKIVNEGLIDKHDDYIVDLECNANNIWYHSNIAAEVRRAIREMLKP